MRNMLPIALVAATACSPKAPTEIRLPVLVNGVLPDDGGHSAHRRPSRGFQTLEATAGWLSCSMESGHVVARVALLGGTDSTTAACVEGDRRIDVHLVERERWSKALSRREVIQADEVTELSAPRSAMASFVVGVEGPRSAWDGGSAPRGSVSCASVSEAGDRIQLRFTMPKRASEQRCVVEPAAGAPFALRFRLDPEGG